MDTLEFLGQEVYYNRSLRRFPCEEEQEREIPEERRVGYYLVVNGICTLYFHLLYSFIIIY